MKWDPFRWFPRGLMVVVAIFGVPLIFMEILDILNPNPCPARAASTRARIKVIEDSLGMFRLDHGRYPEKLDDLVARPPYIAPEKWTPYLERSPRDAWDREFEYRIRGTGPFAFDVVSYGADGKPGGTGDDQDLWNHARMR